MATQLNTNFVGGEADIEPRMLLKVVPGSRRIEFTEATTDLPIAIARNAHDASDDPPNALEYDLLEIGKVYELIASETITAGDNLQPEDNGKAAIQAATGHFCFRALENAADDDSVFAAVFLGYNYVVI